MITKEIIDKVGHFPTTPGVYLWHDEHGQIIYVGKAINLRNRVRSYVRKDSNRAPKVAAMVSHAADVEYIQTKTEMEALILEATLIKEHHPKYNILLRDDKTYPYIKVTIQEDYPRLMMTRRMEQDGAKYYGPFTDVGAVHQTLKVLRRHFPLRTCRNMNVSRPCLQFHLGHCKAPCVGLISKEEYRIYVDKIVQLLDGKQIPLIQELKDKMEAAAEDMAFEKAAMYRDQLQSIEKIQEKQRIVRQRGDMDVLGLAMDASLACVQLFFIRGGRMMGRENFFIPVDGDQRAAIISQFISQYYGGASFIPKELLLPEAIEDTQLFVDWFTSMKGQQVAVDVPQRGYKRDLIKMAQENALTFLTERRRLKQFTADKTGGLLKQLQTALGLPRLPMRMECFDISHNQGKETVASMVVFQGGRPDKREYRRFRLKTVEGKPDDFKSMAEVVTRRYGKEKDWPKPDLIVVDGGKGQLHAVVDLIHQCGLTDVPVIGLAKRLEEVFVEGRQESIILSHHSPELQLLQQLRDEAHRFAITYHRQLRSKRNLTSILDHVEGVGPTRRKALWAAFKTLDAMKQASVDELAQVPSMNQKTAQAVYDFLRLDTDAKRKVIAIR